MLPTPVFVTIFLLPRAGKFPNLPLMQTLAVQFLDQGFHRVLFNAIPMPVFVVDQNVSILEYNTAAAGLVGEDKARVLQHRAGDLLHCAHARPPECGCGDAPACTDCVIRKAVQSAFQGQAVRRQWAKMEFARHKPGKVTLRVTSQPVNYKRHALVLLILEGLND